MGVQGVANVSIWGGRDRQLQVQVDPRRLARAGVSLDQVIHTAGNSLWVSSLSFLEASTPGTGGFFDAPNQRLAVRHESPIITAGDLARVPLEAAGEGSAPKGANGSQLRLGDVASVVENHQPLIGDAIVDGKPGLMLVVEKLPTANTLDVTDGVQEALDALKPGLAGITINGSVFRPAGFIHSAIHDLGATLLIGFGLLIVALALLFYQWQTALVAVASIVSSLVAAVLVVYLTGNTMNSLVFAGLAIALGVVIDDAIVGAERAAWRLHEDRRLGRERSIAAAVIDATVEARRGLVLATIIVGVPLVPVLFLTGLGSAFGRPMAAAYLLALLVSLVVSVTITPAVAVMIFSSGPPSRRESPIIERLGRSYRGALAWFTRSAKPAFAVFALLAVAGLVVGPQIRHSPVPTFKETDFLIDMDGPPGTSLTEMERIVTRAAGELRTIPGVRSASGHAGRAVASDEVVSPNSSQLWVSIDRRADYDTTVTAVKAVVRGYAGIDSDVKTYSEARLEDAVAPADEPVVVRLFGQELAVLRHQAETVTKALSGVEGLVGLHAEMPREEPTLQVEPNLDAARAAGIRPGDIRRAAAALISGVQVGSLFEEQKVFDVVVWGVPETRQNVSAVRDLLIDTPSGGHVRLGDVARVAITSSPDVIERDAVSRRIDITAGVRGRDPNAVLADVRSRLEGVEFPLEYHYELIGNYAERQAVQHRMLYIGIAGVFAIFLLLQAAFGNWRLATLSILTLPVALVGSELVMLVDGRTLELGSLVGLLTVFSIATRNSVMLIKRYQRLERDGAETNGRDLVLRGARERLPAIVMTATATAAAVLPLVFLGNLPGHEIVGPMGRVVLGGLVTSTLLSLFLLPALYLRFGYGRSEAEDLDLRDLWVIDITEAEAETSSTNVAQGL
jgi:Cu/Ag efflux pump CusA